MNSMTNTDQQVAKIESAIDKDTSSAIVVGDGGLNFTNAGEVMEFAKMMAISGPAVPPHLRGNPGGCLGILDDAIRFGMAPYGMARKSMFVNGNLSYESQVLSAIINSKAPIKERPDITFRGEDTDRVCIVEVELLSGKTRQVESPKLRKIHPQNSPLWKSDPDQQLSYYTLRLMARRYFPEILLGVFDIEEAASIAPKDVTPSRPEMASRLESSAAQPGNKVEGFAQQQVNDEIDASNPSQSDEQLPDAPSVDAAVDGEAVAGGVSSQPSATADDKAEEQDTAESSAEEKPTALLHLTGDGRTAVKKFVVEYYSKTNPKDRDKVHSKWGETLMSHGSDAAKAATDASGMIDAKDPEGAAEFVGLSLEQMKAGAAS